MARESKKSHAKSAALGFDTEQPHQGDQSSGEGQNACSSTSQAPAQVGDGSSNEKTQPVCDQQDAGSEAQAPASSVDSSNDDPQPPDTDLPSRTNTALPCPSGRIPQQQSEEDEEQSDVDAQLETGPAEDANEMSADAFDLNVLGAVIPDWPSSDDEETKIQKARSEDLQAWLDFEAEKERRREAARELREGRRRRQVEADAIVAAKLQAEFDPDLLGRRRDDERFFQEQEDELDSDDSDEGEDEAAEEGDREEEGDSEDGGEQEVPDEEQKQADVEASRAGQDAEIQNTGSAEIGGSDSSSAGVAEISTGEDESADEGWEKL